MKPTIHDILREVIVILICCCEELVITNVSLRFSVNTLGKETNAIKLKFFHVTTKLTVRNVK